jgi:hypothetical protein
MAPFSGVRHALVRNGGDGCDRRWATRRFGLWWRPTLLHSGLGPSLKEGQTMKRERLAEDQISGVAPALDPIEKIKTYRGCILGFSQPALVLIFRSGEVDGCFRAAHQFSARLHGSLSLDARLLLGDQDAVAHDNLPAFFARLLTALEMTAGLPSLGRCFATIQSPDGVKPALCFESSHLSFSIACVNFIREFLEIIDEDQIKV